MSFSQIQPLRFEQEIPFCKNFLALTVPSQSEKLREDIKAPKVYLLSQ